MKMSHLTQAQLQKWVLVGDYFMILGGCPRKKQNLN
jgi:hypothetical protein